MSRQQARKSERSAVASCCECCYAAFTKLQEVKMKSTALLVLLIVSTALPAAAQGTIPVVGQKFRFDFGKYAFRLYFRSDSDLVITGLIDNQEGNSQTVSTHMTEIRPDVYIVTWQEKSGTTVTDVQDFARGIVYANITEPGNHFEHWIGKIIPLHQSEEHSVSSGGEASTSRNEAVIKRLLDEAFNKKDTSAVSRLVRKDYIQHNPNFATGRGALLRVIASLAKNAPDTKWELKRIWVVGNYVITQSLYRFSKTGKGYAAVDIFRMQNGKAAEHWDVVQKIPDKSANNNTMF